MAIELIALRKLINQDRSAIDNQWTGVDRLILN